MARMSPLANRQPLEPDPAVLLERARGGDAAAFSQWLDGEYQFLYRLAYRFLGNRPDAEDLTHTVCIELARKLGRYSGRGSIRGWLARVVLNASLDYRRRERPVRREASDETVRGSAPDRVYLAQVLVALESVAPRSREAVLLAAEGLTHAEIAEALDCAEGTVGWHLSTARAALTARLGAGGTP